MTFIWLIVIALSIRYIVKHSKSANSNGYLPPRRENLRSKSDFESSFNETLSKIRQNREEIDRGGNIDAFESDTERIYRNQMEEMFKPGFRDDPKWKEINQRLKATLERNKELAEEELAELKRKEG